MSQMPTGGYVRHRNRMVQESVFQDLRNTLIAFRWMSGTTTRPVVDPDDPNAGWQIITTDANEVLKLVGTREDDTTVAEVVLIDYFPEASRNDDGENPQGAQESRKTEKNTLAVDSGEAQDPQLIELGSNMMEQQYVFSMAFYASSEAVALALMSDLTDRYAGRAVSDDYLNLFNYNDPTFDDETPPIARMEVDAFRFRMNTDTQVNPWEVNLFFAELVLTDTIDAQNPTSVPQPLHKLHVVTGHGAPADDLDGDVYVDLDDGTIYGES